MLEMGKEIKHELLGDLEDVSLDVLEEGRVVKAISVLGQQYLVYYVLEKCFHHIEEILIEDVLIKKESAVISQHLIADPLRDVRLNLFETDLDFFQYCFRVLNLSISRECGIGAFQSCLVLRFLHVLYNRTFLLPFVYQHIGILAK